MSKNQKRFVGEGDELTTLSKELILDILYEQLSSLYWNPPRWKRQELKEYRRLVKRADGLVEEADMRTRLEEMKANDETTTDTR